MFSPAKKIPRHILVNRVDAMGDVILALPVCGLIKKYFPQCKVSFLGRTYTKAVAETSIHVDEFINCDSWKTMSQADINSLLHEKQIDTVIHLLPDKPTIKQCGKAKIKLRIGATNKMIYWLYCNKLVTVSRKKSRLSEAQLNIKLLSAININEFPGRDELYKYYGFSKIQSLDQKEQNLFDKDKFNLIIHPFSSKINAKEWGLDNFSAFIKLIDLSKYKIFITGSEEEKKVLAPWIRQHSNEVTDLTGRFNIPQLIAFISAADGLIASSTGPVHIAAATGIYTLGLYEDRWTKRGERWGPLGKKADFIQCTDEDMNTITPGMVYERIKKWLEK